MSSSTTNTLLIIGALAVGGIILYKVLGTGVNPGSGTTSPPPATTTTPPWWTTILGDVGGAAGGGLSDTLGGYFG